MISSQLIPDHDSTGIPQSEKHALKQVIDYTCHLHNGNCTRSQQTVRYKADRRSDTPCTFTHSHRKSSFHYTLHQWYIQSANGRTVNCQRMVFTEINIAQD